MSRTENHFFMPAAGDDIFKQTGKGVIIRETEVRIRRKSKVSSKSSKSEDEGRTEWDSKVLNTRERLSYLATKIQGSEIS